MMSKITTIFAVGTALVSGVVADSYSSNYSSYSTTSRNGRSSGYAANSYPSSSSTNVSINYTSINYNQMRTSLSNFERTMVGKWRNRTSEYEQRRRLHNLRFQADYDVLADEMFKEAILDDLYVKYAGDESAKEACRCPGCCACWLGMCAPSDWNDYTKNMYWAQYMKNARENGYDTSDLGNMYNRRAVTQELERARASYFGTNYNIAAGGHSININMYGGAETVKEACCSTTAGVVMATCCVLALLALAFAFRLRYEKKMRKVVADEEEETLV